jgi:hypothetical protein
MENYGKSWDKHHSKSNMGLNLGKLYGTSWDKA